jgi:hypothetical protein
MHRLVESERLLLVAPAKSSMRNQIAQSLTLSLTQGSLICQPEHMVAATKRVTYIHFTPRRTREFGENHVVWKIWALFL